MNIVNEIEQMRSDLERLQQRIGTRQAKDITDMDPLMARLIGRKIELERALVVIERLQAQLKTQAAAAKHGMDSAASAGRLMMEKGQRLAAENSPEAIESEREANAILTAENEALRQHNEELQRYNVGLANESVKLREERDQSKAQNDRIAKILNEAPEADHVFTYSELVQHDAEVIERFAADLAGHIPKYSANIDLLAKRHIKQLRQQAKEVGRE